MKRLLIPFLFVFAILTYSCNKLTPTPPPGSGDSTHVVTDSTGADTVNLKAGLLLYLPFNGSIADSSGNNNPTTLVNGAALTVDEHGYANSAFGGTGNGEALVVTNNGSIKFDSAFTVSFHFMTKNPEQEQIFLSATNWATGHAPMLLTGLGNNNDSLTQYHYLNTYGVDPAVGCDNWGSSSQSYGSVPHWKPIQYAWYQYTCIFNKGTYKTYINGQLLDSTTYPGVTKNNFCPSSNVVIGGWWMQAPVSINGKIDEVRLYGRVLNANEIAKLARGYHQ